MTRILVKIALVAGLLAGVLATIAAGLQAVPSHAHFDPESALLVSTRSELRVCLATNGRVDTGRLTAQVSEAFETVRRHRDWRTAGYGKAPRPEPGCTATLPDTGITKGVIAGPGLTAEPGPYRAVVIALGDAEADAYLGDQPAVVVPYELMRIGERDAATVTQAVVVRASFVADPRFATDYLAAAVGLDPAAA